MNQRVGFLREAFQKMLSNDAGFCGSLFFNTIFVDFLK